MTEDIYFIPIKVSAPTLLRGHPISYITNSEPSILDPYTNKTVTFPTKQMEEGIYRHIGNGLYATEHTTGSFDKDGNFQARPFSIGVKLPGKTTSSLGK